MQDARYGEPSPRANVQAIAAEEQLRFEVPRADEMRGCPFIGR